MKKYIISSAIILAALASVSAESGEKRGSAVRSDSMSAATGMMMVQPTMTTGDAATDAKIKVLQTEMEAKIKAIRDEYQVKLKAVIGDKKVSIGNDRMNRGSSTMRMGKGEGREGVRGSSTVMREMSNDEMNASGTPGRPAMTRDGKMIPRDMEVRGESTGTEGNEGKSESSGVRGFFSKFFGR